MVETRIVFLMYHELELPGRRLCQSEPGYVRYILPASEFHTQMRSLKRAGWRGLSVNEAITFPAEPSVAITFDDGCETDLLTAAPILQELDFGATFYVTSGFLGSRGYLSVAELRKLSDLRFEIGCHSMTHPYLPDLDAAGLDREVVGAKLHLEQILGKPVQHLSCPGGRYDQRVAEVARIAGYRTVATSYAHTNSRSTDPFALGRVAIMRRTALPTFERLYRGRGLWQRRAREAMRDSAKSILGNSLYDRFRTLLLGPRRQL